MPYWEHGFGWGWMGILMTVIMLALIGGLGTLVFVLLRQVGQTRATPAQPPDADEILNERFARGEIDDEELARLRAALHRPI